jgi:hypothetical protein
MFLCKGQKRTKRNQSTWFMETEPMPGDHNVLFRQLLRKAPTPYCMDGQAKDDDMTYHF